MAQASAALARTRNFLAFYPSTPLRGVPLPISDGEEIKTEATGSSG